MFLTKILGERMEENAKTRKPVSGLVRLWFAVLALLLCGSALSRPARTALVGPALAESLSTNPKSSEEARNPPPGSAERKAILDALRKLVPEKGGKKALFTVRHMRVLGGWAWVETDPRSADGRDRYEPLECLLRYSRTGLWTVEECRPCCGDCEDDPDCRDKSRYYKCLRSRFPEAPREIFPEP